MEGDEIKSRHSSPSVDAFPGRSISGLASASLRYSHVTDRTDPADELIVTARDS